MVLDSENEELEVVNFGVDGYGMGQSYLRYKNIKSKVDHDIVLLMFVPSSDLWRNINIRRDIGGDWKIYWLMPRFIIDEGALKLVQNPFDTTEATEDGEVEQQLRNFLRMYDRFYFRSGYEEPWLIGKSILYKLLAKSFYEYERNSLPYRKLYPDSEAVLVSQKIFEVMRVEVNSDGKEFILVILPSHNELRLIKQDDTYRINWQAMVTSSCQDMCMDLSNELQKAPPIILDKGYDGTYYGPKANQLMANLILEYLKNEGIIGGD